MRLVKYSTLSEVSIKDATSQSYIEVKQIPQDQAHVRH